MSEGEAEIGRENEARLKEVLEMRKRLLGVSLDSRGDEELGSRNFHFISEGLDDTLLWEQTLASIS